MTTTTSTSRRSSSSSPGELHIRWSTRADGDFHRTEVPFDELDRRRRAFVDLPWTMLDQRHTTTVVAVGHPGAGDGAVGDIAFGDVDGAVLGCWVGDCAPIVLIGAQREFAVVHAGWRGLAAGVVDAAIDAFSEPVINAVVGPLIHPCCYEFGDGELRAVASGVHAAPDSISALTRRGEVALDVPAAVRTALGHREVPVGSIGDCTGCAFDGFSYRVRRDPERHVIAAWREVAA